MTLIYDNLVGIPFDLGKQDCIQTVIDFYKQNFDITIPAFARPSDWESDKLDLIGMLYPKLGFKKLDDWKLQPGDLLATAIGSSKPNHLVIYLGDNQILHHKINSASEVETFRPLWKMVTCYVLRHPDVPDLTPVFPDVTIEDILKSRYKL